MKVEEEGGGAGRRRKRRRASTCSTDGPWRNGGMERRRMWPPTADRLPHSLDMFTVHWRQSDVLESAPPAAPLGTLEQANRLVSLIILTLLLAVPFM